MTDDVFIDVNCFQSPKHRQPVSGDVFLSRKVKEEGRMISVLSDGLGSGVKANVLATLTSTMAIDFVLHDTDTETTARTIMDTLPVCSERHIAYSTFTIVDADHERNVRIIEYDNPPCVVLRGDRILACEKRQIVLPPDPANATRERVLNCFDLKARPGDRIIVFSDGVDQAGLGRKQTPLGLGGEAVADFARSLVRANPKLTASDLARRIGQLACARDEGKSHDDTTCAVIHFRQPRRLLVASGPPFDKRNDRLMAETVAAYPGKVIVCGGTTAQIVGRELGRPVAVDLDELDPEIPPTSRMEGVNLITEGSITLDRVVSVLNASEEERINMRRNAVSDIIEYFLNSDVIEFMVGTRVNEAHQDPTVPVEMDLRRNLMKRIANTLEERYLKETRTTYV